MFNVSLSASNAVMFMSRGCWLVYRLEDGKTMLGVSGGVFAIEKIHVSVSLKLLAESFA